MARHLTGAIPPKLVRHQHPTTVPTPNLNQSTNVHQPCWGPSPSISPISQPSRSANDTIVARRSPIHRLALSEGTGAGSGPSAISLRRNIHPYARPLAGPSKQRPRTREASGVLPNAHTSANYHNHISPVQARLGTASPSCHVNGDIIMSDTTESISATETPDPTGVVDQLLDWQRIYARLGGLDSGSSRASTGALLPSHLPSVLRRAPTSDAEPRAQSRSSSGGVTPTPSSSLGAIELARRINPPLTLLQWLKLVSHGKCIGSFPVLTGGCRICGVTCNSFGSMRTHVLNIHRRKIAQNIIDVAPVNKLYALTFAMFELEASGLATEAEWRECQRLRWYWSPEILRTTPYPTGQFPLLHDRLHQYIHDVKWSGTPYCVRCRRWPKRKEHACVEDPTSPSTKDPNEHDLFDEVSCR